ncbi:MAG: hypothetical protein WC750_02995 [Patescibacteria group bacterium]
MDIMEKPTFAEQWSKLTTGQQQAVAEKVGRAEEAKGLDNVYKAILNGDVLIQLKDATKILVDAQGRCIPSELGVSSKVVDADREFYLAQPYLNFEDILTRTCRFFDAAVPLTPDEVKVRFQVALAKVKESKRVCKLAKGAYLPFVIPRIDNSALSGTVEKFIEATQRAYRVQFPGHWLTNVLQGDLAGKVSIASESRYNRFMAAMVKGPVVGVYFPTAFQGYSIPASREAITHLPEDFILSGALEILAAVVAHTATLARDWHVLGLDCSAMSWSSAGSDYSLIFRAHNGDAAFAQRSLHERENSSAGLTVLG